MDDFKLSFCVRRELNVPAASLSAATLISIQNPNACSTQSSVSCHVSRYRIILLHGGGNFDRFRTRRPYEESPNATERVSCYAGER